MLENQNIFLLLNLEKHLQNINNIILIFLSKYLTYCNNTKKKKKNQSNLKNR